MMRSGPFPGMDPWLQFLWGNVHAKLCTAIGDLLNEELPAGLVTLTQQRVIVESTIGADRSIYPDVHLIKYPRPSGAPSAAVAPSGGAAAVLDEPIVVQVLADPYEQPYIEIVDALSGMQVITVIEIVSPSNRRAGDGRKQYIKKQKETVASSANLVEIDLVRGGRGVTLAWANSASPALETPHHACCRRAASAGTLEVYPITLRQRLPSLRVPLRDGGPDVRLNLQRVLDDVYRRGRLADVIDYKRSPEPPLDEADAQWAAEQVAAWQAGAAAEGG